MRCVLAALLVWAGPALPTEVDLALVIAVDVSRSMNIADLAIQRDGYARAMTSPEVLQAISSGFLGRMAVTYVQWSGPRWQRIVADWTVIETATDADGFARLVRAETGGTTQATSISTGLLFAAGRFIDLPHGTHRRVIDISGDGPNNQGPAVTAARDAVTAQGITVNGLPLMIGKDPVWRIDDLDLYYRDCVIGGPGAFVVPVRSWDAFGLSVRRKFVLEISGLGAAGLSPARVERLNGSDCLIGEKIWQRNHPDPAAP